MAREKVLVAVSVVRAVSIALAGWAVFVDGPALAVYALVTLSSAAAVLFRPVHSALLPSLCDTPPELAGANVVRGALDSAATLAGPAVSAVLLATAAPAWVLVVAAVASAWAALLMARVHPDPTAVGDAEVGESALRRTMAGVRAVQEHRDLKLLLALVSAQTFMRGAVTVFTAVVAIELVGLGEPGVGLLNAALGAGAVVASVAAALLVGTRRLAAWFGLGAVLWGAPIVVIGLVPSAASAMVMLAVVGAGNALIDVGGFTLIARMAPPHVLARVFGLLESIAALSVGVGALVTPLVMAALDLRTALVVLGLITPTAVALSWRRLTAMDHVIGGRDDERRAAGGTAPRRPPAPGPRDRRAAARPRRRARRRGGVPPGRSRRPVLRRRVGDGGGRRRRSAGGQPRARGVVRRDRAPATRAPHGDRPGGHRAAPGDAARRTGSSP